MPDDARQVAFDPRAPADERYDAQAELQRQHRPSSDREIRSFVSALQEGLLEDHLIKARGNNGPSILSLNRTQPIPDQGMRSVSIDDMGAIRSGNYYEKNAALAFDAMRTMVEQTPVLNAVLLTRIRQVGRFCQISEDGGPGFEIRSRHRDQKLQGEDLEAAKLLGKFFQNCGWEFSPRERKRLKRDSFTQFMAKSVRDSLTLDSAPIETEMKRNRSLGIDGFYAVDGTTIRLCAENGYEGDDEIYALQVVQGRVSTTYTHDQLIYEVRNPRADVNVAGYGLGETELLIRTVTGFLNAMTYNISGFDQNAIPRGMLQLTGDYDQNDITQFRRYWNQMVKGINNAWALPVMVSKNSESKATFQNFGVEYNEMYFAKWMSFLTSIICAIYGMSPDEINFESFASSKSSLSGSDTEQKLENSKDLGLRPLMAYYEAMFTDFIVTDFSGDLCFRWVGLEEEDQAQAWEAEKLTETVDELRAKQGNSKHPDPIMGGAPLNPALMGLYSQMHAPQPQPEPAQGGDFGEEDGSAGDSQPADAGQAGDDGGPGRTDEQSTGPAAEKPGDSVPDRADFGGAQAAGDFGAGMRKGFPSVYAIEP